MSLSEKSMYAEGFERVRVVHSAVPHFVWKIHLDIEFDRDLRLVEEVTLGLVDAGVSNPVKIAELMGLDDERIVPNTIIDLLRRGAITHRDSGLYLQPLGRETLARSVAREVRHYTDVEVRHDPYRNELHWSLDDDELKEKDLRELSLRALPAPSGLSAAALESRHLEVQALLEREGLPFDAPSEHETQGRRREIIRMKCVKHYVAYREAHLEVWYGAARDQWRWRLLRGGGEEAAISTRLAELESEGHDILPLDDRPKGSADGREAALRRLVDEAVDLPCAVAVPTEEEIQGILRDAILSARRDLTIFWPFLSHGNLDQELLGWIRTILGRNRQLRATILVAGPKQTRALHWLRSSTERAERLRVVETGANKDRVALVDDVLLVVGRSDFLAFAPKPEKGIWKTTQHRISDPTAVARARSKIDRLLGISAITSPQDQQGPATHHPRKSR